MAGSVIKRTRRLRGPARQFQAAITGIGTPRESARATAGTLEMSATVQPPTPIYFYLADPIPAEMPSAADVYWTDFERYMRSGVYAWIVQTYQRLRAAGFPCELVTEMPAEGIVVTYRKSIPPDFHPPENVLLICVRADATFHHFAHLHVVLNRNQVRRWYPSHYLPHWRQNGLIPRASERGETFENVAFFGDRGCLVPAMQGPAWEAALRALGLTWQIVESARWHDFSRVDAVVAVRGFGRHRHDNKPPTKLFNAWHAGVPAILGRESAYQHERRGALDYLEARSVEEVLAGLRQWKGDAALRQAVIANGRERARESEPAVNAARWQSFFNDVAMPAYEKWRAASAAEKRRFFRQGALKAKAAALRDQAERWLQRLRGHG